MNCPIRQFKFPYKGIFPVSAALSFPDLSRHSFSSQTDSVDSDAEVILNLLALALELHGFCGHFCPFRSGGIFRLALPRHTLFWGFELVSFPDFTTLFQYKTLYFPCVCRFLTSTAKPAWASQPSHSDYKTGLFCHPEVAIGLAKAANCAIFIHLLSH